MDSLKIRPAASGDAATIGRLLEQLGYPTDAAEIPERIEKLHARPGTTVLVAENEIGELLGVVTVHIFQTMHSSEPAAWLTALVVEEKARGQYKARDYEHTGVRLTKVFVNRSGSAPRGGNRSSRKAGAKSARNRSRA